MENQPQIIIAIDREFGSGGQFLARQLANHFQIPLYEKNILQLLGMPWNDEVESFYTRDSSWILDSKTLRGMTGTNEEIFSAMEFQFLQDQAAAGRSFVVLGHCAEVLLEDNPFLTSFFINASDSFKIHRIMTELGVSDEEALRMMKRHNRKRQNYHKAYCSFKWGDARHYNFCLYSDILGLEKTASMMIWIMENRILPLQATQPENQPEPHLT